MLALGVRTLKRGLILAFGWTVIYVAVWRVFPFFDARIPVTLALLATYIVMAYFAIPFTIRLLRVFFPTRHIPHYCVTPDGFASDPVNIGLIGTRRQVIKAMKKAGWHQADPHSFDNIARMVISFITRKHYHNAPMSTLYLFGRKQDLGFQLSIDGKPEHRHHVRFWAVHTNGPPEFHEDVRYWQRHQPIQTAERLLWIGCASKDIGLALIRHNAQFTHMIDFNTNAERDLIVHDLYKAKRVKQTHNIKIDNPFILRNRAWRGITGLLHTDGKLTICELKN